MYKSVQGREFVTADPYHGCTVVQADVKANSQSTIIRMGKCQHPVAPKPSDT